MRLWSIHPQYLDRQGLLALWRESLLAKKVLEGQTRGYKKHPQLLRFLKDEDPLTCIQFYLQEVHREATERTYHFDSSKFTPTKLSKKLNLTVGQLAYERAHLLKKLKIRAPQEYQELKKLKSLMPHPLFRLVEGPMESWERSRG